MLRGSDGTDLTSPVGPSCAASVPSHPLSLSGSTHFCTPQDLVLSFLQPPLDLAEGNKET
jgi:hypothetical protein